MELPGQPNAQFLDPNDSNTVLGNTDPNGACLQEPGETAVYQIHKLIDDLSKRLNSDLHDTGITSSFLDACLQEFFERISPCFPVIHGPTFKSGESIPPLLLNIVALGSLFVCLPGSLQKGEMLWRLGHTAVATSWQTLIGMRGPRDACDGIQLVLTALLGQTYALLSSNHSIRRTAFVFHGLGFYWARTCDMYTIRDTSPSEIPSLEASGEEKNEIWRTWAASEVQRRAILGHYILDGLISQASGSPASARHLINATGAACSDVAFAAKTADEWILEMARTKSTAIPMSEVFVSIFSANCASMPLQLSSFTIFVCMEGLQSLVADLNETSGPVFGAVSRPQIIRALLNLYHNHLYPSSSPTNVDSFQLLIRWHTICLELATPSTLLYRRICELYKLPPLTGGSKTTKSSSRGTFFSFDLEKWAGSADAARAVLHATAITRILNQIPLRHAHATHLPAAIFASAVVLGGVCLGDKGTFNLSKTANTHWDHAWASAATGEQVLQQANQGSEAEDCIPVHLLSEMNFLQISLKTIASRWGVSAQMEEMIGHLAMICRERLQRQEYEG
ncbi:hypothetical protein ASPZODRAFT_62036 [Penicilliopsis zonata CBS 506.65]|uniref:Xylanolytic transcriptional activator regulatory domain-containing protein n=1 Tax=Penicilliopsis zonata CBS 506.65 TaxID=1073090 RepID=A0A1L9SNH8_9EURO|nr:hypothetical protein ASPZODRAFT_62036 [Penicilliopsis zonata CBS 506.65]OJJ48748.1 hypothetical protein ASPZODRAFT_62036 [Penicilliopsis zonata CBS 506.65]